MIPIPRPRPTNMPMGAPSPVQRTQAANQQGAPGFYGALQGAFADPVGQLGIGLLLGQTKQAQGQAVRDALGYAGQRSENQKTRQQDQRQFDAQQALREAQLDISRGNLGLRRQQIEAQIAERRAEREASKALAETLAPLAGVDPALAENLLRTPQGSKFLFGRMEPSELQNNLREIEALYEAGSISPEEREAARRNLFSGDGITINNIPKAPSGYTWQMDEQGRPERLAPIRGGPAEAIPSEVAGKAAAASQAREALSSAEKFYLQGEGESWAGQGYDLGDRARDVEVPFLGRPLSGGESGRARRDVMIAIEAALRLLTGAAATEPEVRRFAEMYAPGPTDNYETIKQKLTRLRTLIDRAEKAATRGRGGPIQAGSDSARNVIDMTDLP